MNWEKGAPAADGWYLQRFDQNAPNWSLVRVKGPRIYGAGQKWGCGVHYSHYHAERLGPLDLTQILGPAHGPALRSELDALASACTGEVTAPSYASIVKELHLTRLALNEVAEEKERYRQALIKTGCNDIFCADSENICRNCPAHNAVTM